MGVVTTIAAQLKSKLDAIDSIKDVSLTPKLKFKGYPAAIIIESGHESDYETTDSNERVYAWEVRLYQNITVTDNAQNTGNEVSLAEAYSRMRELVDVVIDAIDQDEFLTGISMPSGKILNGLKPLPSVWDFQEELNLLQVNLTVQAFVNVDIS